MNITQIVCIIVIFFVVGFYVAWRIYKEGLRKTAVDLIVEAEKRLKNNELKFLTVVNEIIIKMPFPFNMIPANIIENFVQKVFDEVKVALDYQKGDK